MYKLMLVDDEQDVREGVVQEIDWQACGFEVIEIAENGQEALELMEKQVPDIVVTDIQMPFMNGMQMSELIREKYPMTKIIILTGHDEFEYAQKAVKLHIDEYVLKPFSSQELMQAILKVKDRMDAETAEKENMHILREHYRDSLPVLREAFLASLLTLKLTLK
jgi:two-component system, response regulator YesN